MTIQTDLSGKCAIITGASRGIGRACALHLAKAGTNIALLASSKSDDAERTLDEVRSLGVHAIFLACDVSSPAASSDSVKTATSEFGHIDILVNNAGITSDKLLISMTDDDFDQVLAVNLKGTFNMTRACMRGFMKQRYGRIVNVTSVVGMMGNAGQANYAASKAGVIGFTKSIAKEYAAKGITCNAVAPGYIETSMTDAINEDARRAIISSIPENRTGTPDDLSLIHI